MLHINKAGLIRRKSNNQKNPFFFTFLPPPSPPSKDCSINTSSVLSTMLGTENMCEKDKNHCACRVHGLVKRKSILIDNYNFMSCKPQIRAVQVPLTCLLILSLGFLFLSTSYLVHRIFGGGACLQNIFNILSIFLIYLKSCEIIFLSSLLINLIFKNLYQTIWHTWMSFKKSVNSLKLYIVCISAFF